jgi:hypothetical protein
LFESSNSPDHPHKKDRIMQLSFKPFDGRSRNFIEVIDQDSNRVVGQIRSSPGQGIHISLFDQKYVGTVSTYEECLGFVRGVESVLNRMTSADDGRADLEQELFLERRKHRT